MPNRPVFALLVSILLSFPMALLAGGVVQTEKFNYPLTNRGKFTIDDANGTITISCRDQNEVEITATKHAETQADLDAIRIDIKQRDDKSKSGPSILPRGLIMAGFPIKSWYRKSSAISPLTRLMEASQRKM
jgi:hypothetical protein